MSDVDLAVHLDDSVSPRSYFQISIDLLADGRIYLQNEEGLGVVLQPGKEFRKLAENAMGERTLASYAVDTGALFIRTEQNLYKVANGRSTATASQ